MDDIIVITSDGLSNDIVAGSILNNSLEVDVDVNTSLELGKKGLALTEGNAANGNVWLCRILK
jgi:hypothetical protein